MGGSTPQPTQSTTTSLSPQAEQLFQAAYPKIATYAAGPPPSPYPGSSVSPFTSTQLEAQQAAKTAAGQQADIAQNAVDASGNLSTTLNTQLPIQWDPFSNQGAWNPDYNAGLQSAIEATQRPIWQNLTENQLPAIRSTALSTGPTMGSRAGIAEGLATSRAGQTASDAAQKMIEDLYGSNLGAVQSRYGTNINALAGQRGQDISGWLQSMGIAPTLQGAVAQPAETLGGVGDVQYAMNQAQLQDTINKYNYNQVAPYLQAKDIMSLIAGLPGQETTTSTGNVAGTNPATSAVGSALSGAAVGSAFGPGGALIGAAGGATLPFLFR
jgi:hypothetical protein